MGRVPALRAESVFYWIRQEKRKRRDAIVKLEAQIKAKNVDKNNYSDHPPLPIKNAIIDLQINTTETILIDSKGLLKIVDDTGDGRRASTDKKYRTYSI